MNVNGGSVLWATPQVSFNKTERENLSMASMAAKALRPVKLDLKYEDDATIVKGARRIDL